MDEQISKLIDKNLSALETLHNETAALMNAYKGDPVSKSKATVELRIQKVALMSSGKNISQNDVLGMTLNVGTVLIELAADHLVALQKVLKPISVTLASWTCLRVIIESCAFACWLFDPTIDLEERMRRGFACRYKNLEQQLRLANSTDDITMVAKVRGRLNVVADEATALGYSVFQANGKITGIGEQTPDTVRLVNDIFGDKEEHLYRISSGVIHGNFSFIQSLGFRVIPAGEYSDTGAEEVAIEKILTLETLSGLCKKAALVFIKPVWFKSQLYGWSQTECHRIFDDVADKLEVASTARFWH